MKAFVFVRPSSPQVMGQEFGHVGWGFQVSATEYSIGAVENTNGLPFSLPGHTDFWTRIVPNPLPLFSTGPLGLTSRYDLYKELTVTGPNVARALGRQQQVKHQPYSVVGQNCMNRTFEVLRDYGATNLPDPATLENVAPILWFQKIGVPAQVLLDSDEALDVALYEHPNMEGRTKRFVGAATVRLSDLTPAKLGFSVSSIVVKRGQVRAYKSVGFAGDSFAMESGTYRAYLDEWNENILSLELQPLTKADSEMAFALDRQQELVFAPNSLQEVFVFSQPALVTQ